MFGKRGNDDGAARCRNSVRRSRRAPVGNPSDESRRIRATCRTAFGAHVCCRCRAGRKAVEAPPRRAGAQAASRAHRNLLRHQVAGLFGADRYDRPVAARQAGAGERARRNPRHRQRHHRDQELRDVDRRAGGTARGHLQRRARLWSARTAAGPRRHRRHHGQRLQAGLHRDQRQGRADRHPLPRQPAAAQHMPAHRQPGRPPRRRIEPDLRRPPSRRLARQRDRAAAVHRRRRR